MVLKFKENYNNKLNRWRFTTIRACSDFDKYHKAETDDLILDCLVDGNFYCHAKIKGIDIFYRVEKIPELVLCNDTGLPYQESIDLINSFYPNKSLLLLHLKRIL